MRRVTVLVFCAAMMALTAAGPARAAEIKVIAANAVKESLVDLLSVFEKSAGHKVTTIWGGTNEIAKRIGGGEVVDIVLIGASEIDKLIAEGKLLAGSRADFARSGVGVAVRAGLPKPDISSSEAVKKAVLEAKAVAYSSGPSGYYVAELFKKLGIADQIKDKVKQPTSGGQIGDLLARGEADLGFHQVSELLHRKDIEYLGPLPPEIQNITVYAAGVHTSAAQEAAKDLIKFLTAPAADPVIRKTGMEPG